MRDLVEYDLKGVVKSYKQNHDWYREITPPWDFTIIICKTESYWWQGKSFWLPKEKWYKHEKFENEDFRYDSEKGPQTTIAALRHILEEDKDCSDDKIICFLILATLHSLDSKMPDHWRIEAKNIVWSLQRSIMNTYKGMNVWHHMSSNTFPSNTDYGTLKAVESHHDLIDLTYREHLFNFSVYQPVHFYFEKGKPGFNERVFDIK